MRSLRLAANFRGTGEAVARSRRAISDIIERLEERYPQIAPAEVRAAVEAARQHFARARVKDFVPLFIERDARARIERPVT